MSWSSQCNGLTKARVQCRRSAPGGYCWQHTDQQRKNYSISYTTSKIDTHDILSGRKCRGKTVQGSKCKTVLVHQTGEYCWQHTYQAENYDSDSSDSGTRRCRGQTLKHARCKRMLVHYPGHYCWQHTEQAPLPSKVKKEKEKLSSQIVLAKAPKAVVPPHVIYYDEVYISPNPSGPILVMPPPRILAIAESADFDSSGTESSSGNGDFAEDSGFFEMATVDLLNDSLTIEEGGDASFANVKPYTTVTTLRSSDGAGEPEEKEREEEKEEEKEEAEVVSTNTGTHTDVSPVEDGEKTTVDNTSTTNYLPPPPESLESGIVSLLLLDAPRVPTEVPSEPKSKATLGVTTWTVLDLPGEQKQLHTEKSQKPRASRSCGFNWLSTALMYPFRHLNQNKPTAIVPSASPETSVSTEKIAAVKQENIECTTESIGFSTATQILLASLLQDAPEEIHLLTSLPSPSGQIRMKLGRDHGPTRDASESPSCEMELLWKMPVANSLRVEQLLLTALGSEFDSGRSTISGVQAMVNWGKQVQCPCKREHDDIFLTRSSDSEWLKELVGQLDRAGRAEQPEGRLAVVVPATVPKVEEAGAVVHERVEEPRARPQASRSGPVAA